MENNIIEGVYIQALENKKVVQKYVPLSQVFINGKVSLGEHLDVVQAQIAALNKEIETLKDDLKFVRTSFGGIVSAIGGVENA